MALHRKDYKAALLSYIEVLLKYKAKKKQNTKQDYQKEIVNNIKEEKPNHLLKYKMFIYVNIKPIYVLPATNITGGKTFLPFQMFTENFCSGMLAQWES